MSVLTATVPALALALSAPGAAQSAAERFEAERMQVAPRAGHVVRDGSASGRRALLLAGRGRARARILAPGPHAADRRGPRTAMRRQPSPQRRDRRRARAVGPRPRATLEAAAVTGKAVFVAEYELDVGAFCARGAASGLMAMRKRLALDAWRQTCW